MTEKKFMGSLVGLAVGDALGMPYEGMSASQIKAMYGRVEDFRRGWLGAGKYTDDTKMMICHAQSIVQKGGVDPEDIAEKFIEWYDSGDWRGMGRTCY